MVLGPYIAKLEKNLKRTTKLDVCNNFDFYPGNKRFHNVIKEKSQGSGIKGSLGLATTTQLLNHIQQIL